jgi:hypothetical protein
MTFRRRSTFPTDLTGRVEAESTFEVANLDDSGVWRRRWSVLCLRLKKVVGKWDQQAFQVVQRWAAGRVEPFFLRIEVALPGDPQGLTRRPNSRPRQIDLNTREDAWGSIAPLLSSPRGGGNERQELRKDLDRRVKFFTNYFEAEKTSCSTITNVYACRSK